MKNTQKTNKICYCFGPEKNTENNPQKPPLLGMQLKVVCSTAREAEWVGIVCKRWKTG